MYSSLKKPDLRACLRSLPTHAPVAESTTAKVPHMSMTCSCCILKISVVMLSSVNTLMFSLRARIFCLE